MLTGFAGATTLTEIQFSNQKGLIQAGRPDCWEGKESRMDRLGLARNAAQADRFRRRRIPTIALIRCPERSGSVSDRSRGQHRYD